LSEEEIKEFFTDYTGVIQAATGRELDRIKKHIEIFERPTKIRYNKAAQKLMLDQLDIYRASSAKYAAEETNAMADRLHSRFQKWYKESDAAVVDGL
jgi:hypothetical protein